MSTNVRMNSGSFTVSDGSAATNIACGFVPEYIRVANANVATTEIAILEDFKDQADGDSFAHEQTDNDGGSDATSIGVEGTNGLSAYNTNSVQATDPVQITGGQGFTIPAAFYDTNDVIHWVAWGHD